MKTRTDLINFFIEKFNYKTYLEIGIAKSINFEAVICESKDSVDPAVSTRYMPAKYIMTSDEFFTTIDKSQKWDIIFIDGYHEKSQVKRDILNALNHLNDNGTIVCHDVNPKEEWLLASNACWNAWEAFAELRTELADIVMHTVEFDHSGFIRKGTQELWDEPINNSWYYLNANRKELMKEITVEQLNYMFL